MVYRRRNKNPRLLSHVIKAVKNLKDIQGSSVGRITDLVRSLLNETRLKPKPRNVVMQVRRALKHAVQNGILVHRAGHYRVLKRRSLVPVDSLELIANKSNRNLRVKKTRRRASSRGRRSRRRRSRNKRHSHSRNRRHMRHRSSSEESASPAPNKRRTRKKQQKKKKVTFEDQQKNGQNPSKEKVSSENNENTGKNQDTQNKNRIKLSQRPKTPYSTCKDLMDNEQNKPFPKQDRPQRRRQLPAARHRSMSRPRTSKPFTAVRGPTDDEEFGPSSPKKTSRTSHEILEKQKESSTDLEQPDHDDTSSESLPDDDDDNQERENPKSY